MKWIFSMFLKQEFKKSPTFSISFLKFEVNTNLHILSFARTIQFPWQKSVTEASWLLLLLRSQGEYSNLTQFPLTKGQKARRHNQF